MIWYGFTRDCVEDRDFTHFLSTWGSSILPDGPDLRSYLDKFPFWVGGYDDDPRELFAIREVRSFFREFNSAWPFWFFACNLDMPSLLTMTLCCLDTLQVTQQSRGPWRADFKGAEMRSFIDKELGKMEALCQRAGLSEDETTVPRRRVLGYFRSVMDMGSPGQRTI